MTDVKREDTRRDAAADRTAASSSEQQRDNGVPVSPSSYVYQLDQIGSSVVACLFSVTAIGISSVSSPTTTTLLTSSSS